MSLQLADSLSIRSRQHVIRLLVSSLRLLLLLLVADWWTRGLLYTVCAGQDITERMLPELQILHPAEVALQRILQNARVRCWVAKR